MKNDIWTINEPQTTTLEPEMLVALKNKLNNINIKLVVLRIDEKLLSEITYETKIVGWGKGL